MTQSAGRRIKQGQVYDYEGVKVLSMENSSAQVVKVAEIVEHPPGVFLPGVPKWVHSGLLKEIGTRYTKGEIP
ncbi:MAG: hypothetical protein V4772_08520 [Pseudomonadota bacterium]